MTPRRAWVAVRGLPAAALIGFFRLWQILVSPQYGQTCRFYPSCSAYGLEAVRTHGALRGLWLTARRLLRCHPWNPGGVDPVPPRAGNAVGRAHADDHDHGVGASHPYGDHEDVSADPADDHASPPKRRAA